MSEINSVLTSSNKMIYSKVNITSPVDGINYFNKAYHLVDSHHFKVTMTAPEIIIKDTNVPFKSYIQFCHIHGSITKDLSKGITYYSINNQPMNGKGHGLIAETIAFPANPYSKTDYFDYVYIPPLDYESINYYLKTHNNTERMNATGVVLDMTVDYYSL